MARISSRKKTKDAEDTQRQTRFGRLQVRSGGLLFTGPVALRVQRRGCDAEEVALDLARELEQVAIFWFDGQHFWILGAIVETDPLMLPRSS